MKAYKGFNQKLQCTPGGKCYQFEIGKAYEEESAKLCSNGFHACENPIDVFGYYPPIDSRYCEVELDDVSDEHGGDSKICGRKIKIGAEIGIKGIVDAFVKCTFDKVDFENSKESNTGYQSAATNTGYQSAATNTGYQSAATNTGNQSAATNTGHRSAATNTGYYSAATNTGHRSAATNTGKDSVAIATGYDSKAKACKGSAIVVCERGEWNGITYPLIAIKAAIVDGKILKENTFYKLVDGEFVECE